MIFFKILVLILLFKLSTATKQTIQISVGFVYCEDKELNHAQEILNDLNNEIVSINSKSRITISLKGLKLKPNDNTISLSLSICQNFINREPVYAVVVGKSSCLLNKNETLDQNLDNDFLATLSSIAFTCAYYQIPIIDLYNRDATFSDKVSFKIFYVHLIMYTSNFSSIWNKSIHIKQYTPKID